MSTQELLAGGGGLLMILMTLIQIAPVKFNPWSALAKAIGKAINADISRRLDAIEKKLDGHIIMDDRRTADNRRAQILHFNNELLRREVYKERLKKRDFLQESHAVDEDAENREV